MTISYVLLEGVNDREEQAELLAGKLAGQRRMRRAGNCAAGIRRFR